MGSLGDGGPGADGMSLSLSPQYMLSYCRDRVLVLLDMNGRQANDLPSVGALVSVWGMFSGVGVTPPGLLPYNCTAATPLTDELLNVTSHTLNVSAHEPCPVGCTALLISGTLSLFASAHHDHPHLPPLTTCHCTWTLPALLHVGDCAL